MCTRGFNIPAWPSPRRFDSMRPLLWLLVALVALEPILAVKLPNSKKRAILEEIVAKRFDQGRLRKRALALSDDPDFDRDVSYAVVVSNVREFAASESTATTMLSKLKSLTEWFVPSSSATSKLAAADTAKATKAEDALNNLVNTVGKNGMATERISPAQKSLLDADEYRRQIVSALNSADNGPVENEKATGIAGHRLKLYDPSALEILRNRYRAPERSKRSVEASTVAEMPSGVSDDTGSSALAESLKRLRRSSDVEEDDRESVMRFVASIGSSQKAKLLRRLRSSQTDSPDEKTVADYGNDSSEYAVVPDLV